MPTLLPSETLSLKYDAPHQRGMTEDDQERERYAYDRFTAYFERDRQEYISSDDRAYSNPISI